MSDADIDAELDRLEALSPLGHATREVWGRGSDPNEHTGVVAEIGDELGVWIADELRKRGIALDALALPALAALVGSAMIAQHQFTERIVTMTYLLPFVDSDAPPPFIQWPTTEGK
jgi:hypothetical protein